MSGIGTPPKGPDQLARRNKTPWFTEVEAEAALQPTLESIFGKTNPMTEKAWHKGVIDWMEENLSRPGAPLYEPWTLYWEHVDFLLRFYRIDPLTGRRRYHRALLSRVRDWSKSPVRRRGLCS